MMSLETTNEGAKFEILKPFLFFFALSYERIFIKTHNIGIRLVIGPENRLCVQFLQPGNFTGCSSDGVNARVRKGQKLTQCS